VKGSDAKENFAIVGSGVSESADQHVHIRESPGFNIGAAGQPPRNRPGTAGDTATRPHWPGTSRRHPGIVRRASMSEQSNLNLVRRMYEALNAQDLEAHHEFWHDDMIWHGPPGFGDVAGPDGFRNAVLKPFYAAFPDYHVRDEIQVASGD